MLDELSSGNDRSAVIVAGALADEMLRRLIESVLRKNQVSEDLLARRALRSFRTRIDLAYALGLIEDRELRQLDLLHGLRNAFAHKIRAGFTLGELEDAGLKSRLAELGMPHRTANEEEVVEYFRSMFSLVATVLMDSLWRRLQGLPEPISDNVSRK